MAAAQSCPLIVIPLQVPEYHFLTLSQSDTVPAAKQQPLQSSSVDSNFSFRNTIFPDECASAGDLFLNGKILPIGIRRGVSSSNHVRLPIPAPPQHASLDATHSIRQFSRDFVLERLKEPINHSKEVDGHESNIIQESLSPYKRYSVSGKIHRGEIKPKIASRPRLKLPFTAFLQFDKFKGPPPRLKPLSALLRDHDLNNAPPRNKPLLHAFIQDEDFALDKRHMCSKEIKKNRSVEDLSKEPRNLKNSTGSGFARQRWWRFMSFSSVASEPGARFEPNVQQVAMSAYNHRHKQKWRRFSLCLGREKR